MVQILPSRTNMGAQIGASLGQGLSQGLSQGMQQGFQSNRLQRALSGLRQQEGQEPLSREEKLLRFIESTQGVEGAPEYFKQYMSSLEQPQMSKEMMKRQEQAASFQQGLQTVQQMRQLMQTGDIGKLAGLKVPFSADTRKNRQQFETLGTSLIGLYGSTLPTGIRNRTEFEEYMKGIARPGMTEGSIEGSLNALETLFKTGMARQQIGPGPVPQEILQAEQQAISQLKEGSAQNKPTNKKTLEEIFGK